MTLTAGLDLGPGGHENVSEYRICIQYRQAGYATIGEQNNRYLLGVVVHYNLMWYELVENHATAVE